MLGCNPVTHAGCAADQLCCDADGDGNTECVGTSLSECTGCGVACAEDIANTCADRKCGCGAGAPCAGDTPFCDGKSGACVACDPTSNAGCSGTTPVCTPEGQCVGCAAGANSCPQGQICLPTGACECKNSEDCAVPSAPVCDEAIKQCRGCSRADECQGASPACDTSSGRCVECVTNTECGSRAGTPFCDPGTNRCVSCLTSGDCTSAQTPICSDSRVCVECNVVGVGPAACAAKAPGTVCVRGGLAALPGSCGACDPVSQEGCSGRLNRCLAGEVPMCVDCLGQADCADGLACLLSECQACSTDVDCAGHPLGGQCVSTTSGRQCRLCDPVANEGCTVPTPTCNPATFACE